MQIRVKRKNKYPYAGSYLDLSSSMSALITKARPTNKFQTPATVLSSNNLNLISGPVAIEAEAPINTQPGSGDQVRRYM